jgi:hypothetical protein
MRPDVNLPGEVGQGWKHLQDTTTKVKDRVTVSEEQTSTESPADGLEIHRQGAFPAAREVEALRRESREITQRLDRKMGSAEHVADPKVDPPKVRARMHSRLDGPPDKLRLGIHKNEKVTGVVKSIPIRRESLGGTAIGLKVLECEVLDNSVGNMNPAPEVRTQKQVKANPRPLELVEEADIPVDGLVHRAVLIQTDQSTDKGRLHTGVPSCFCKYLEMMAEPSSNGSAD